uniref:Chaperone DnaJ C-terminal domain-containing protein n=1 Tax=Lygus hesperus TaxID=30085 RepID=A0A0K8S3K0_LYGHE
MMEDSDDNMREAEREEEEDGENDEDLEEEEEEEYEYPHNVVVQIKRQLTVHGKMYLSLAKIEEGSFKKMRFHIVALCPKCKGANHVQHVDLEVAPTKVCPHCNNSKLFATKTEVYTIYAPVGTRQGSSILIQDEGSFGPQGIRGDIIVTFMDEPHEHFLRVFDDIVVCFQINSEESTNGVVRLLTLVVPTSHDIVLRTTEGEPISNNDVWYVDGLGLPNCNDKKKRGRLILVFIVKEQRSMLPVKLKDIKMTLGRGVGGVPDGPIPDSTFQSAVTAEKKEADSTASKSNGLKRNRPPRRQNPKKRRKGVTMECKASTSSDSLSAESESPCKDRTSSSLDPPSVEDVDTEGAQVRCSRILGDPVESLTASELEKKEPLDPKRLSFLDRIVYLRAIPMPWKARVGDAIPMSNLILLWQRIFDPTWWQRAKWTHSLSKDPDTLMRELAPSRGPSNSDHRSSFVQTPVFDVQNVKLNEEAEALKTLCTMQSSCNTEYPQFTPQKFTNKEKLRLLHRMRKYLHVTED